MFRWAAVPFVRFTLYLITGILLSDHLHFSYHITQYWLCLIIGIALLVTIHSIGKNASGIIILNLLILIGLFRHKQYQDITPDQKLSSSEGYIGTINKYPNQKKNFTQYHLKVDQYLKDSSLFKTNQRILLHIKKDDTNTFPLKYGDRVFVSTLPNLIKPPLNPHSFDYASFMAKHKIFYSDWVETNDVLVLEKDQGHYILQKIFDKRHTLEKVIKNSLSYENTGIALALLLGIKNELSLETKQAFSSTGAMHVLAVSGLHVGILYLIVSFLFKKLQIGLINTWLTPTLSIIIIWLYAMLAGFSPSILRASLTFTFLIIGQSLGKKSSALNATGISAFTLLLINPNYLYDVGFQLSYSAIIGILIFYEPLHKTITIHNWLGRQLWSLVCLSIVAQISTAPISSYYFHQFPGSFLFSNLLIFTLIYPIMITGFLLLIFHQTAFQDFLSKTLNFLLHILTEGVSWLHQWSWLHFKEIQLTPTQVLSWYALIGCLFLTFHKRNILWLKAGFIFAFIISSISILALYQQSKNKELVFYSNRKSNTFERITGLHSQLYNFSNQLPDSYFRSQIYSYRLKHYLQNRNTIYPILTKERQLTDSTFGFIFYKQRYLFIRGNTLPPTLKPIETDYLILSNTLKTSIEEIEQHVHFHSIILNPLYKKDSKINIELVQKKGYDIYDISKGVLELSP